MILSSAEKDHYKPFQKDHYKPRTSLTVQAVDIKGYGVLKNLHFWSNLSANSFITWRTVWEFEICAQFWNKWIGFDFYRQLTDRLPTLPTSEKVTPLIKNLHFWSNLSANIFVKSI